MISGADAAPRASDFAPGKIVTGNYSPFIMHGGHWWMHRKPPFTLRWVPYMLQDSRVRFGLWLLKGPLISNMSVEVRAGRRDLAQFIIRQLDRFWEGSAVKALRAIEWGYSGSEAVYRIKHGLMEFDYLKPLFPYDVRVLCAGGKKVGMRLRRNFHRNTSHVTTSSPGANPITLWGPKSFWHIHMREEQAWYGVSRLQFCYPPWFDKYKSGGSVDGLSLFFFKYALQGSRIYFPPHTQKTPDGQMIDPEAKASEIANQIRSGGTLCIPNMYDANGNRMWEVEEAKAPATGEELIKYQDLLDRYIFQGLGIPTELIEAGASGSGYAGRRVPAQAFYGMLQELADALLWDFDEQIIHPLVWFNFGRSAAEDYSLRSRALLSGGESEGGGQTAGQQSIGPTGGGLSTHTLRGKSGSALIAPRENPHQ